MVLKDFKRKPKPEIGDKVVLDFNPCSKYCSCYYDENNPKDTQHNLKFGVRYTVKEVFLFGGGCPSISISLEEIPSTYENGLSNNYFKIFSDDEIDTQLFYTERKIIKL